jgi:hypothetical protein
MRFIDITDCGIAEWHGIGGLLAAGGGTGLKLTDGLLCSSWQSQCPDGDLSSPPSGRLLLNGLLHAQYSAGYHLVGRVLAGH